MILFLKWFVRSVPLQVKLFFFITAICILLVLQRTPSVDTLAHQTPTDPVLQNIADYIAPRDWQLVANKLGFTLEDIDKFEKQHPKNPARQV